jgi:hypothetical protein
MNFDDMIQLVNDRAFTEIWVVDARPSGAIHRLIHTALDSGSDVEVLSRRGDISTLQRSGYSIVYLPVNWARAPTQQQAFVLTDLPEGPGLLTFAHGETEPDRYRLVYHRKWVLWRPVTCLLIED